MISFLVTGGAGFIGSNLVESLLAQGHPVRVLDNFSTGKRENLRSFRADIDLIEGDIRSYHIVHEAMKNIDIVLHQAALPSVPRSISDPITTHEVNTNGTLNVLNAARESGVRRVVFASSSSIYGNSEVLPKHEAMLPDPLSPYAVSKLTGEKYMQVFHALYGLETVCLRYFNVFGPRQDPNSQYSAVIPKFIAAVLEGRSPVIHGDGEQTRDFTYVANVVTANLLAAEKEGVGGSVVNIACHERVSLNTLARTIIDNIGVKLSPSYDTSRLGDVRHSLASIDLARERIGYAPEVTFLEGIASTIDYYAAQRK